LSTVYTGGLVAILAIDVYPKPPQTIDEIARMVEQEDLTVGICCRNVVEAMEESNRTSLKTLYDGVKLIVKILKINSFPRALSTLNTRTILLALKRPKPLER